VNCCTYILPIRRSRFARREAADFADYFKQLAAAGCEVLVIDGSSAFVFAEHHRLWSGVVRHEHVDQRFHFLNDKVNGVHTGVRLALCEKIVLADDDIRYRKIDIERMCALLEDFEVVRPQNYLSSIALPDRDRNALGELVSPWVLTEAARMLINRATLKTGDYPGTCGFLRQTFLAAGEYDGDVLFDNEELIRHLARRGARIAYASDFFIRKCPPTFGKWLEQRPRQAYEDFGLRFKTILFALVLPIAILVAFINPKWLLLFALSILIAFAGWLRGSARNYFPLQVCLFAPLWILERTVSTYCAFWWRISRGGYPFGERLLRKGIGRDWIEGGRIEAKLAIPANEQRSQHSASSSR
jgi:hypothetical protein